MADEKKFACDIAEILAKDLKVLPEQRAKTLCKLFERAQQETFDNFVVEEGFVEKDDLLKALSRYYNVPSFDVRGHFFEHHLVRMFPKDVMLRRGFIPLMQDGPTMVIVAANPADSELPEIVGEYVSYDITFVVGLQNDIDNAVKEFYDLSISEWEALPIELPDLDDENQDAQKIIHGREEE